MICEAPFPRLFFPASAPSVGAAGSSDGGQATTLAADETPPRWDLSDLYASADSPVLAADRERIAEEAKAFAGRYRDRVATLSGAELAAAIGTYQAIDEAMGRIGAFASLSFSADMASAETGRFSQSVRETLSDISTDLLFFTLELNKISDGDLEAKLADPALGHWRPFFRDLRMFRPHQLADEIEQVLLEKSVTGASAWCRLFDEQMSEVRVPLNGKELTLGEALNLMSDPDRAVREKAGRAVGLALQKDLKLYSLITNTLAKDKAVSDKLRQYPRPESYRNLSNMVEDEVVDALVSAVVADYPRLSHRYYALKAKWLGLEKLEHWDRNAPLPGMREQNIPWSQAKSIVRQSYDGFDPRLGSLVGEFLDRPWIDAAPVPGKSSGAFAHPVAPSVHPYVLMNYRGRTRDVMTLAHELGHGAHQILAAKQGYFMSSTPLTLAETASVFGEMLTFQHLLDSETDPEQKRLMLAAKVEDMLNTVVRQIAFYRFEGLVHGERRNGELLPGRIGEIWRQVQTESLGPAFHFTPEYDVFWSYVPHFIHSPFYVYAYAFGDCLVNALYGVYQGGAPGFQDKYLAMLSAGGTKRHKDLLAPFGLDASDPGFWRRGLDVISGLIDQLEVD
ncbi:M3 family oligoendopeptidase [Acetobacter fallax]|uniref:M3 family oligoendopeptidase n=1 Tax=Acetobacter fallax TaxID=1737473 RepID=A0ABX0KFC2_9PROT|nr:M3 family oligoendopeptidase [Acetobacter fallax]NHO33821.1 M3 family oligoendopeptidase [Acetobacter fallax]NHO37400.1 M3 family oligoendopeptidase [Acetobacter fallax]